MERKQERLIWLAVAVFGALLLAACGSTSESTADNTVAATVNGKKIMTAEVERNIQQQSQGKQSQLSAHDLAQARLQVLDGLIKREVLYQRAEQEKLLRELARMRGEEHADISVTTVTNGGGLFSRLRDAFK